MNRWGRHQVCLSSVVLRPFSLPASNACLCTCMQKKKNNKNACMHAHSALSTCLPPPIPLLYIKTKKTKTKKPITRFFTNKFKCIQLHGLIYSFLCVWTCLASLVEIDTRLLFSFLAACCQNLNKTSEGARLHHHTLKEKADLICNWFVSKYPFR